jgi:uncharacterized protein (TIGR02145 family)
MKKLISSVIAFSAVTALLCLTCGDNGASSKSPENDGAVDAFAGKFNRKSGQAVTPNIPSGVTANAAASSSITLSWNSVTGAIGYYVYRSTSASGTYSYVTSTSSTSYINTGLLSGTTYYYKVSAYNGAGESSLSSYASATTTNSVVTPPDGETFIDTRDNKIYKKVKIGNQWWMGENLNYAVSNTSTDSSWCYENNADSCAKYGRLYNWNTAMAGSAGSWANPSGVRGVCPEGWHLPSNAEWEALMVAAGGYSTAGKKLKSKSGWYDNGNGTDDYGFSALPGGYYLRGSFDYVGSESYWWLATERDSGVAYRQSIYYKNDNVNGAGGNKGCGFSVRCVGK